MILTGFIINIKKKNMAKIKGNLIMMKVSGMIGKQVVIKHRNDKPYISAAPTVDEDREPTPNQKAWQLKFKSFVDYGKVAAKAPETRPGYMAARKKGQSAYNVAFRDARYAPEVTAITAKGYTGRTGDLIFVQATDDFRVTAVKVLIYSASGELIEEGNAVTDNILWMYQVTVVNLKIAGSKIVAKAYDLPGNEAMKEVTL